VSNPNEELQAEAIALVRQYGWILPQPVRAFLTKLADFLNWQDLKKEL
jgi:hypothetical protein